MGWDLGLFPGTALGVSVSFVYRPTCISFLLLCNKLLQTQHLKTTKISCITVSIGQESRQRMAGFSAQDLSKSEMKTSVRPRDLFWGLWAKIHFQAHSCCWQNSVSGSCGTEVSFIFLAASQGPLSASRFDPHSLSCGPLHIQALSVKSKPLML